MVSFYLYLARKREAALKEQVTALEKKIGESDAARDSQVTELRENLYQRETALTEEIDELRKELEEKDIVKKDLKGKLYVYRLTDNLIKKWSKMLGFNI